MKNIEWNEIQKLFDMALELNEDTRKDFLKSKCGANAELYEEVLSLLNEDNKIHPVLNKKASELINVEEKLNLIGKQIGSYKIIKEIATGGMGSVFLAERCDGVFEQKVALKIIKPGLSTIPIIRRFQNERQILANLHHPNIAKLFDGGVTEDRRPFFTMEYVDGIPIDEYCDNNKLSINERLNLFIKVCSAVQYAHNNLVVHRDLKPNNILIQKDGTIKLLDFGISKVLSAESEQSDLPTITQAEINLITPEYSSPEQIKNSNISVSTDVYSLGLILYKLLIGRNAHKFESRTFSEFEKVICEQNISKPSTILIKQKEEVNELSDLNIYKSRKTNQKRLKNILSGDLDNICLMALRKEPERRYASVEMLAYDVQRYLDNLPILARKESPIYSTKKFIVRHKAAVITAVVLFFIVNGLILFYTIQLKKERDKATLEAKKSAQVSSFLQDLFLVSDPNESKGKTITARELLDRGSNRLKETLTDEPEIKTQLLNTIGKVYTNLGLYNSAEEIFIKIKENSALYNLKNETIIESLINLGKLYRIEGKYKLAGEILFKALEKSKNTLDKNNKLFGDCYINLGGYFYETGDYKKSYEYFKKAEKVFKEIFGEENEKIANVFYNQGILEFDKGHLDKSDSLYREAIKIEVKLKGEINADVATFQNALGQVLRHKEEYAEAKELYEKALNTRIKLFGKNHADVAHTLNHLSRLYYNQNLFDKAEPLAREALKIRLAIFDEDHPEVSASRSSLAGILFEKGKYKEAENLYRQSYQASLNKLGESHPYTPALLSNISRALIEQGKYKEGEQHLLKSVNMFKKIFNNDHRYVFRRNIWLADLYNRISHFKKAEILLREQLAIVKNNPLENNWITAVAKSQLGYSLFKQSNFLEAEGLLIYGFNLLKEKKSIKNRETQKALNRIIEFYKNKKRKDLVKRYSELKI